MKVIMRLFTKLYELQSIYLKNDYSKSHQFGLLIVYFLRFTLILKDAIKIILLKIHDFTK